MEDINLILGNKLLELRRMRNIKQEHVARELGISQQQYSLLEHGKRNFTMKLIKKICDFFQIPVTQFLNTGNSVNIHNSPNSNSTNSIYNDKDVVNEIVKSKNEVIEVLKETINKQNEIIKELKVQLQECKKSKR